MTPSVLLDGAVVCFVGFFAVRGVVRGLTGEFFSLLGILGGIFLAWRYQSIGTDFLASYFPSVSFSILQLVVVVVLFLISVIAASCACRIVRAILRFSALTLLDRILGMAVGTAKAVLVLAGVLILVSSVSPTLLTTSDWAKSSMTVRIGLEVWPTLEKFLKERNIAIPAPSILQHQKGVSSDDHAPL